MRQDKHVSAFVIGSLLYPFLSTSGFKTAPPRDIKTILTLLGLLLIQQPKTLPSIDDIKAKIDKNDWSMLIT